MSISHIPYTIETLSSPSTKTALVGTVKSIEAGTWNTQNGSKPDLSRRPGPHFNPEILTPVNLSVDEPVFGDPKSGAVRVLNEGGTSDCSVVNVPSSPRLEVGGRYVFWLSDGIDFDGTHRPDLHMIIAAWSVDHADNVTTEEDGVVPLADLVRRIKAVRRS
jgi:hypothetical protein